ncbi:amino acid adenylation domain-containing protein [Bradyrhizobium sp. USDA 4538]|nr:MULTISPECIES: non-ribosomal peptide synthetase [unclassified Bradyrhizobium]MCP1845860.1 amino acid adenylation domain-containing protein [Bradyrhizobium sp. USDA 4538]MCP1907506.1 amino acid adenylation domain-containing protein [Bradyrhizobium sp. USDA 4537]MCP1985292.1 amino acid adenylation domain-containing protein [Bradyrhizobium sp. USDA 4539]
MGDQPGLLVLQADEQVAYPLRRRQPQVQRQRVDEQAGHSLDAWQLRRPSCDRDAEDDYVVQLVLELSGPLEAAALQNAIQALLQRHANLRAGFLHQGFDAPVQIIPRDAVVPWRFIDLTTLDEAARTTTLAEFVEADKRQRFDPAQPPLLRVALIRLAKDRHQLVFTHHHILLDGWSMPILLQELFTLYRSRGGLAVLPHLTPYRDYLAWLSRQDVAAAQAAWRDALADLSEPTRLAPIKPAMPTMPQTLELNLPSSLTDALGQQTRRHGVTLNTLLQGAWGILLRQLTGRDDVVFGITVAGRPPELPGIERMAGLFINTLPLYLRLPPAERVSDLLVRLQDQQSRLIAHQHLGLAEIQRMAGHGELFDTLLVFENYPVDPADQRAIATPDGELQITGAGGTGDISHYALGFLALPGPELHIKFAYRPDLFDRGTVEVISRRLVRLLEAFVADPTQPIGQIDLLDPAERKQILLEWNSPAPTSAAEFKPVTTRISEQALNAPDRVAISCEGVSITYGDLEAKTNQVAQHLTALKVKRDERVGLCVGRSLLLPIGLLGVLKAGGAFVPLDATSPKERLLDMAADAGIRHLIVDPTNPSHPDLEAAGYNLIHIADLDESTDSVGEPLKPDQLAYVIYTSGSTGRPKGVALSHRALIQHIDDFIPAFNYTSADRVVQFSPMTFDAAIEQLLPVLTVGGQVIMRGDDVWDLETFSRRLSEERATVADIPITFWRQWMRTLSNEPTSLRRVTTGGEAVPGEGVREWRNGPLGSVRLDNRYGPTETAMSVLYHTTTAEDEATSIVPIGRPYPGRTAYLMDEDCNLVPVGAVGELCIGGDSVARGYLNRPALTAEQFVPDPYGTPGKRLYRTGDLCRQRPDGLVEFIGRSDDQVKIRGYRIEPGEIEALLARDPDVANAKVIVREDRPGQKQLVAYVVPRPEATVDPVALRRGLSEALPDYMVPSAIVVLDDLPTTLSGKLDRQALPAPEFVPENIRPPRTPQEKILAGLFAEVLGLERVSIDDSFFDLGGHSMLAARLTNHIRSTLGIEIGVRTLFDAPSVARLSEQLFDKRFNSQMGGTLTICKRPRNKSIFCFPPSAGISRCYAGLAGSSLSDYSIFGLQSPGLDPDDILANSLTEMVELHAREILRIQTDGPYHLLGWSFGGIVAYEVAVTLQSLGKEVGLIALLDTYRVEDSNHDRIAKLHPDYEKAAVLQMRASTHFAHLTDDQLNRLIAVWKNNGLLADQFVPKDYVGDVLIFTASGENDHSQAAISTWEPYVRGKIEQTTIPCKHLEMCDPLPLTTIASTISQYLRKRPAKSGGLAQIL